MRDVIVLSVVLGLSMVASYVSWTSEDVVIDDEAVVVFSADPADIQALKWESEELTATVTRKSDDKGDYLWVETESRKKRIVNPHDGSADDPALQDGGDREITEEELQEHLDEMADEEDGHDHGDDHDDEGEGEDAPEPEYEIEVTNKAFKGSSQADDLWESFAPLEALRELDAAAAAETVDFSEPAATIVVSRQKGDLELLVGGETYGSKDKYVKLGDRVVLVDDATLRPLEFAATRLIDRALVPMTAEDARKIEVTPPAGATIAFVQMKADDPGAAYWASADDQETPDETAGTWVDKVFRLRLRDYPAADEVPADLTPQLRYALTDAEGASWAVDLLLGKDEKGEDAWFARSEHTRATVSVPSSLARNVVDDVGDLAGN